MPKKKLGANELRALKAIKKSAEMQTSGEPLLKAVMQVEEEHFPNALQRNKTVIKDATKKYNTNKPMRVITEGTQEVYDNKSIQKISKASEWQKKIASKLGKNSKKITKVIPGIGALISAATLAANPTEAQAGELLGVDSLGTDPSFKELEKMQKSAFMARQRMKKKRGK